MNSLKIILAIMVLSSCKDKPKPNIASPMTTQKFKEETFQNLKLTIAAIDDSVSKDIYAISFFKDNVDDDPRHPILTVGFNTITQWQKSDPRFASNDQEQVASDSSEAKWNYAFWLQNEVLVIGGANYDPVTKWVRQLPYYYTDQQEMEDDERTEILGLKIQEEFIDAMVDNARRLHHDGIIRAKFGADIPIIIHEIEYSDSTINWTKRANPKAVAKEFENWVKTLD